MKICFIGDRLGRLDEGMKSITYHLSQELSKHHEVMVMSPKETLLLSSIREIRSFCPQVIHYLHGPSIRSFIITKFLSKVCKGCRTVMSAIHPGILESQKILVHMLRPDFMFVQSHETEKFFSNVGCKTEFISISGTDINRFIAATSQEKTLLRKKYALKENEFVILHVGPIKKLRNLQVFAKIQKNIDGQVLIIGGTSTKTDRRLLNFLQKCGCIIWLKYFPNIEELFKLSDVYVFPTLNPLGCVELPLTILQAMSCNLPVISTKFRSLTLFNEGSGLFFTENENDFLEKLSIIKARKIKIDTRTKVLPYSWENVSKRLTETYYKLLNENA